MELQWKVRKVCEEHSTASTFEEIVEILNHEIRRPAVVIAMGQPQIKMEILQQLAGRLDGCQVASSLSKVYQMLDDLPNGVILLGDSTTTSCMRIAALKSAGVENIAGICVCYPLVESQLKRVRSSQFPLPDDKPNAIGLSCMISVVVN